jgi:hypothetical protein
MKFASLRLTLLLLFTSLCHADFKAGGQAYLNGDYETAAKEFIPLAERGDHRAMYALGSMYAAGQGVAKDLNKSFALFTEAAQNGRADAIYKLGLMYELGEGITRDPKKAARYYQKSAKKGYPLGQYRLGLMYMNGNGIKRNLINAYSWLVIAGHYFIYNAYDNEDEDNSKQNQLLLFQQQEKDKIFTEITQKLQSIRTAMTDDDIEKTRQKVLRLSKYKKKYHPEQVKNIKLDARIENLFLPETLY